MKYHILKELRGERKRQRALWGIQNHSPAIWLMILGEEVGEACSAAHDYYFKKKELDHYREELIQVAAVAIAAVECLDRDEWRK